MIKDKLIPLGITFTIISGFIACEVLDEPVVEETSAVEVEEPIETKPRVVRPTKIQSLYLNIELGSKFDENLFTGLEFLGERGTRSSINGGYLIYAFGTEDEYIEVYIDTNNNDEIYQLDYNNTRGNCTTNDMWVRVDGESLGTEDTREEQIYLLQGGC